MFRQGREKGDATALHSPSGLISGFSGRPCPEIAGAERNIKKSRSVLAMTATRSCAARAEILLPRGLCIARRDISGRQKGNIGRYILYSEGKQTHHITNEKPQCVGGWAFQIKRAQ